MIFRAPEGILEVNWNKAVFLAGSIEMGEAEHWQLAAANKLNDAGMDVLDPRRLDWDSSWVQSIENEQFRKQVEWELLGLEMCQFRIFNFLPDTKSPVTLLELGYSIGQFTDSVVVCPKGFWRRGNVEIICKRNEVKLVETLDEAIDYSISEVNRAQEIMEMYDRLEKNA